MILTRVPVAAYDSCWFFGDDFGKSLFEQHFQARKSADYNGYVKAKFDTRGFFSNFVNGNPSAISRMSNLMSNALSAKIHNRLSPLPKVLIVVPEMDLVKEFKGRHSVSKPFTRIINYVMTEHE